MTKTAVAIVCKTPLAGRSKTRLAPPLRPEECAAISACFIRDVSATVAELAAQGDVAACALYTPAGSEDALRVLLPENFRLVLQGEGDLGARLIKGTADLLTFGFEGVVLVNSDAPTLPLEILRAAVDALRAGAKDNNNNIVLGPAADGGYTLIAFAHLHARLFEDIPWSTGEVYRTTLARAQELGLEVTTVPGWYDVDDAASLRMLEEECAGRRPAFAAQGLTGASAPATRQFIRARQAAPGALAAQS